MKRTVLVGAVVFLAMVVSGCGGGDHERSVIVQDIISEGGVDDGDITFTGGIYSVFTSDQSPHTIFVDFETGTETRGFITFSLAKIPVTASIRRATVFLPILRASSSVALFPDMVTFSPLDTLTTQTAMANVFDFAAILQGPSFQVFAGDAGSDVTFDATDAVIEANRPPALPTLQIRLISAGGQVEIDDLFSPTSRTPLLRVEYF